MIHYLMFKTQLLITFPHTHTQPRKDPYSTLRLPHLSWQPGCLGQNLRVSLDLHIQCQDIIWALSSEYWQNLTIFNPSTALTVVLSHSKSLLSGALASTLLPLPYIFYTLTRGIPGILNQMVYLPLQQNSPFYVQSQPTFLQCPIRPLRLGTL